MVVSEVWTEVLRANAAAYARVAVENIEREFPSDVRHLMTGPDDLPRRPRERTPVFYGSFDWHSCVEMHWLLVRLLRVAGDAVPETAIRSTLERQFAAEALEGEADFIGTMPGLMQRPYGWGWALALGHELGSWDDPDARRWSERFAPLAEAVTERFLRWLPKVTYPIRYGVHGNTAFGLGAALPYAVAAADAGRPELRDAIDATAHRLYAGDIDYPGGWEPSGADFLSPALVEMELMSRLLPNADFVGWLDGFMPHLAKGEPAALFTPAVVSDSGDGQTAHLHGLNASRAWCWRRLAEELPAGDPRIEVVLAAMREHADAALPHVVGDDYMVEHWLAAYAVLLLS